MPTTKFYNLQNGLGDKQDTETKEVNELIVMSNLIARATTRWTIEQSKLFLALLTRIETMKADGWIHLKKTYISHLLHIESHNQEWVKANMIEMQKRSQVIFNEADKEKWRSSMIFTDVIAEKDHYEVKVNETMAPLLRGLKNNFTQFYIENVVSFKTKSALKLYLYLTSWTDTRYAQQSETIPKGKIHEVFGLKEDAYWINYQSEKQKFHFKGFERRVLEKAISDINTAKGCDMRIDGYEKQYKGRNISGYIIRFHFINTETGRLSITMPKWYITEEEAEADQIPLFEMDGGQ